MSSWGKQSLFSAEREHDDKPLCTSCFQEQEMREATHFVKRVVQAENTSAPNVSSAIEGLRNIQTTFLRY